MVKIEISENVKEDLDSIIDYWKTQYGFDLEYNILIDYFIASFDPSDLKEYFSTEEEEEEEEDEENET